MVGALAANSGLRWDAPQRLRELATRLRGFAGIPRVNVPAAFRGELRGGKRTEAPARSRGRRHGKELKRMVRPTLRAVRVRLRCANEDARPIKIYVGEPPRSVLQLLAEVRGDLRDSSTPFCVRLAGVVK